jgi:tetrahydromethanopterin:alpha-L-glutamate ligase
MKIGIVVTDSSDWTAQALVRSIKERGAIPIPLMLGEITADIDSPDLRGTCGMDSIIVRDIGAGAFERVSFKFDLLKILAEEIPVINTPEAIRNAANKYYSLHLLRKSGLPVPKTVVTCDADVAMDILDDWGEIVIKPIFGYKGIGITRYQSDPGLAIRNRDFIEKILFERGVLYLQEFIPMNRDIRAYVVGETVAGSIYRYAEAGWITNLSQSGRPERCMLDPYQEEASIRAAEAIGATFAGVDIAETEDGFVILEVNGTPSGKGIFEACGVDVTEDIVDCAASMARH